MSHHPPTHCHGHCHLPWCRVPQGQATSGCLRLAVQHGHSCWRPFLTPAACLTPLLLPTHVGDHCPAPMPDCHHPSTHTHPPTGCLCSPHLHHHPSTHPRTRPRIASPSPLPRRDPSAPCGLDVSMLAEAVRRVEGLVETEASGNVVLDTVSRRRRGGGGGRAGLPGGGAACAAWPPRGQGMHSQVVSGSRRLVSGLSAPHPTPLTAPAPATADITKGIHTALRIT